MQRAVSRLLATRVFTSFVQWAADGYSVTHEGRSLMMRSLSLHERLLLRCGIGLVGLVLSFPVKSETFGHNLCLIHTFAHQVECSIVG